MNFLNKHKIFLFLFLSFLLSYPCFSQTSYESLLKAHKWQTSSIIASKPIDLNNKGKKSTNIVTQNPVCTWDNLLVFKDKHVIIQDDNEHKCNTSPNPKGSWSIKENILLLSFAPGKPMSHKIIRLDDKMLVFVSNKPFIPGGVDVTYTYTAVD